MSAHTPGPWVADSRVGGVVRGGPVQSFVNGSGQQQVALATGQEYMKPGEQAANARLIAAAPDLLAACEALIDAHRAVVHGEASHVAAGLLNAAEAAIAKARGTK